MKKKIKSSLLVKVFLITSIMLLCVSLLVFGLLAWLMPQTYSNRLNAVLDKRVQGFVSELEKTAFLDSGGLFDQFLQDMEINSIELYDNKGGLVPLPTEMFNNEGEGNILYIGQAATAKSPEITPVLSSSYHFSFLDCNDRYMGRRSKSHNCSSPLSVFSRLFCLLFLWLPLLCLIFIPA